MDGDQPVPPARLQAPCSRRRAIGERPGNGQMTVGVPYVLEPRPANQRPVYWKNALHSAAWWIDSEGNVSRSRRESVHDYDTRPVRCTATKHAVVPASANVALAEHDTLDTMRSLSCCTSVGYRMGMATSFTTSPFLTCAVTPSCPSRPSREQPHVYRCPSAVACVSSVGE